MERYIIQKTQKLLKTKLRGHSDTEIILELFEKFGLENVLDKLIGMFAFALYDRKLKKLFLCRDRIGKKPLFWSKINDNFIFSSELKSLMCFPGFKKKFKQRCNLKFFTTRIYSITKFYFPKHF